VSLTTRDQILAILKSIFSAKTKPYEKRLQPVNQGPRGSCLMKKNRGRKSCVRIPLKSWFPTKWALSPKIYSRCWIKRVKVGKYFFSANLKGFPETCLRADNLVRLFLWKRVKQISGQFYPVLLLIQKYCTVLDGSELSSRNLPLRSWELVLF
jgi:hypothetical protein